MTSTRQDGVIASLSASHIDALEAALAPVRSDWRASDHVQVELEGAEGVVAFAVSDADLATIRALNRLVRDVLRANRLSLTRIADPPEPERCRQIARQSLDPVRQDRYREGEYGLDFGAATVRFVISTRDADLLRRYHRLLLRIYTQGQNQEIIDRLVSRRSRPPSHP